MSASQIDIKKEVQNVYGGIAKTKTSCCSCNPSICGEQQIENYSTKLGYSDNEVEQVPDNANLGLGCGNPTAIASLKEAETVIDLGSGGGFDCFLASKKVGPNGKVIGIDMTQDMIDLATMNATNKGYTNVEFRLGEIENLPVATGIADVIISNCVVNLSPEKEKVFREASRVLKPGGRIAISDVVALGTMPDSLKNNPDLYTGCMSGAMEIEKLKSIIENSGFGEVEIRIKPESREYIANWAPGTNVEDYVISADIRAIKI